MKQSQTSDHDLHQKQEEGMLHMGKKDRDLYLRNFVTSPRAITSAHMAELADRWGRRLRQGECDEEMKAKINGEEGKEKVWCCRVET